MKKRNKIARRRGMGAMELPPLDLGDMGAFPTAMSWKETASLDNAKDLFLLGGVGAGTLVAQNLAVGLLSKLPVIGPMMSDSKTAKFVGPLVPIVLAFLGRHYLGRKWPRQMDAAATVLIGSALYTYLESMGFFKAVGVAGLMGLGSDVYIPDITDLTPPYASTPDYGVPQGTFFSDVVNEGTDFASDFVTPGQEEDEYFEPTSNLQISDGGSADVDMMPDFDDGEGIDVGLTTVALAQ